MDNVCSAMVGFGFAVGCFLVAGLLIGNGLTYKDGHKEGWIDCHVGKTCYVMKTNENLTTEWVKVKGD